MRLTLTIVFNLLYLFLSVPVQEVRLKVPEPSPTTAVGQTKTTKQKRDVTIKMKNGELKTGKFVQADNDTLELETPDKGRTILAMGDVESIVFPSVSKTNAVYSSESLITATAAIKTLYTMATATNIGVNRRDYGARLIDVKVSVGEALASIPDGEVKEEIRLVLSKYEHAAKMWDLYLDSKLPSIERAMYDDWDAAKKHIIRAAELLTQIINASKQKQ
jgi:hypothetical protein